MEGNLQGGFRMFAVIIIVGVLILIVISENTPK